MGGSAGHIQNLWEDMDLTFKDLKNIIQLSAHNKLENVTQKLDGQNLLVTFKNGIIVASRTTRHLKNFGEEALTIPEMKEYFNNRKYPFMGDIYCDAMKDLEQSIIPNVDVKREFLNGQIWINLEILCEESENIIHYGIDQLRIHHLRKIDEKGNTIEIIEPLFINKIDKQQSRFFIDQTNKVSTKINNADYNADYFINKYLNKFDENITIGNHLELIISKSIKESFNRNNKRINLSSNEPIYDIEYLINALSKRWVYGIKKPPINILTKNIPLRIKKMIYNLDMNKNLKEDALSELIHVINKWSIIVLNNAEGIVVSDKDKSIKKIQQKVKNAIYTFSISTPFYITFKKNKFSSLGGLDSITPIEGLVFKYKEKNYKISGTFLYVLRMVGYHKFKK